LKVAEYGIFATQLRLCVTGLTLEVSDAGRSFGGCLLAVVYLPLNGADVGVKGAEVVGADVGNSEGDFA
jgi:hypothetical protein